MPLSTHQAAALSLVRAQRKLINVRFDVNEVWGLTGNSCLYLAPFHLTHTME